MSNLATIYLPPAPIPATPPAGDMPTQQLLDIIRQGNYSHIQQLLTGISADGDRNTNTTNSIYTATGVMAGVVAVIIIMLMVMIYRNRRKEKLVNSPIDSTMSTFPVSDIRVRKQSSESPTLIHSSKLSSADGSSKVLLSWLEDLPTHSHGLQDTSPGHHGYQAHGGQDVSNGGGGRSPQRQRMLTNGSFVKVSWW